MGIWYDLSLVISMSTLYSRTKGTICSPYIVAFELVVLPVLPERELLPELDEEPLLLDELLPDLLLEPELLPLNPFNG